MTTAEEKEYNIKVPLSYVHPELEIKPKDGGMGMFAKCDLPKLVKQHYKEMDYGLQIDEQMYQVPIINEREPADCVNHCCMPNAGFKTNITLWLMRDISAGEEITFDYAMCESNPYSPFDCECQAENCRKQFTGEDWKLPELQQKYDGYFSPYLAKKIKALKQ